MTIHSETETPGYFRQVIRVDAHTLHADVEVATGGAASAPSPHDYFDTALATCKALTACVYAKSRGYALDRIEVDIERDASREREGVYVLRAKIMLFGTLSDEEKQKVHGVIERCPVHKLMTKTEIQIETAPFVP
jgi:putative redox protein